MAVTIRDIAEKTGLGVATISSYLNGGNVREKNRIKIEKAIKELHFEVNETARGLKTNTTKMIGVIIPELNNTFAAEIVIEVEDLLRKCGYLTIICDCRSDAGREKEAVEFLIHRRVDGMLVLPSSRNGKYLEKLKTLGKPLVLIDQKLPEIKTDCVLVNNKDAVSNAVKILIDQGHTEIGIILGPENVFTAEERYQGYCEALKEAGLERRESLIVRTDYTIEGGATAIEKLVTRAPEMTAVIVSNYELTMGAIIKINELEIHIPEDLSFIGFDNIDFARTYKPQLSIVTQPTKEIAREAFHILIEQLKNKNKNEKRSYKTIELSTSYVEGKSIRKR